MSIWGLAIYQITDHYSPQCSINFPETRWKKYLVVRTTIAHLVSYPFFTSINCVKVRVSNQFCGKRNQHQSLSPPTTAQFFSCFRGCCQKQHWRAAGSQHGLRDWICFPWSTQSLSWQMEGGWGIHTEGEDGSPAEVTHWNSGNRTWLHQHGLFFSLLTT